MGIQAAGMDRRTQAERDDQRLSWNRADQAFFAAGACHVLAWVCRDIYPSGPIGIVGLRPPGTHEVFHVLASWDGWLFDHCGWHREEALLAVNEAFEGCQLERLPIGVDLVEFCREHDSRLPQQYYADPVPRAVEYVHRFTPPWSS